MVSSKFKNYKSFNSKYIGGWTFEDGDRVLTIKDVADMNVKSRETPDGELKQIVYFEELDKPLILNTTNADTIEAVLGTRDYDSWVGKQIVVGTTKVRAFGDVYDAVRVRDRKPEPAKKSEPATEAQMERIQTLIADGTINEPALCKYLKISEIRAISRTQAHDVIKAKTGEIIE